MVFFLLKTLNLHCSKKNIQGFLKKRFKEWRKVAINKIAEIGSSISLQMGDHKIVKHWAFKKNIRMKGIYKA